MRRVKVVSPIFWERGKGDKISTAALMIVIIAFILMFTLIAAKAFAATETTVGNPEEAKVECTLTAYGPRSLYLVGPRLTADIKLYATKKQIEKEEVFADFLGGKMDKFDFEKKYNFKVKDLDKGFESGIAPMYRYPLWLHNLVNGPGMGEAYTISCPIEYDDAKAHVHITVKRTYTVDEWK
jgi:hypothetical protein